MQKHNGGPIRFDLDACMNDASRTYLMGKSPFPALDAFVEALASTGNVPGDDAMIKHHFSIMMNLLYFSALLPFFWYGIAGVWSCFLLCSLI